MGGRYQMRVFESVAQDGSITPGTLFQPHAYCFSVYAESSNEAERLLRRDIERGKHPRGRVYQICPPLGNGLIRSVAASLDGSFFHVFMDPDGPYSDLRRLRLPRPTAVTEPTEAPPQNPEPLHAA